VDHGKSRPKSLISGNPNYGPSDTPVSCAAGRQLPNLAQDALRQAWQDYLARQQKPGRGTGSESAIERLTAIEARDDLARRLAEAFDEESLKEAAARVRLRVDPRRDVELHLVQLVVPGNCQPLRQNPQ